MYFSCLQKYFNIKPDTNGTDYKFMYGTGRRTGLEYTIDFLANSEFHDVTVSTVIFVRTLIIRQNGKLIARLPIVHQMTINANGELVHDFEFARVDCK